jgi:hypothetical protein
MATQPQPQPEKKDNLFLSALLAGLGYWGYSHFGPVIVNDNMNWPSALSAGIGAIGGFPILSKGLSILGDGV